MRCLENHTEINNLSIGLLIGKFLFFINTFLRALFEMK
jgi:hypothetical protein